MEAGGADSGNTTGANTRKRGRRRGGRRRGRGRGGGGGGGEGANKGQTASKASQPKQPQQKGQKQQQQGDGRAQKSSQRQNPADSIDDGFPRGKKYSPAAAAAAFGCSQRMAKRFSRPDPLNGDQVLQGYQCRKEGSLGGSLYLVSVAGRTLEEPQLIFGTPKLQYPYKGHDSVEYDLPAQTKSFFIGTKYNGVNILMFKYADVDGNVYVSAKTKGSPTLSNTPYGDFLDLTIKAMEQETPFSLDNPHLSVMRDTSVQSCAFELCGRLEPHLVAYDFDLALMPLFTTAMDGRIRPCVRADSGCIGPEPFDNAAVVTMCREAQSSDLKANEAYRAAHNLKHKYEHDHFEIEGRVLYCLDENGFLLNRVMYKIKPRDIEEVHWSTFDVDLQGRVREAHEKIVLRGKAMTKASLMEELDMGPKEWGRFGGDVLRYATELKSRKLPPVAKDHRRLVMLAGLSGCDADRFGVALVKKGWTLAKGGHDVIERTLETSLAGDYSAQVAILTNLVNREKRRKWSLKAQTFGVLRMECVYFEPDEESCRARVKASKQAHKLNDGSFDAEVRKLSPPQRREQFAKVYNVKDKETFDAALEALVSSMKESALSVSGK